MASDWEVEDADNDDDGDVGYYGPFEGWPAPPEESEWGLLKNTLG